MGHVNNAVFFSFFEHGRLKFFYSKDQKEKFPDISFILAHANCDYLIPVTLESDPILNVWVKRIGGKSFCLNYQLVEKNNPPHIYATGESTLVCFDYQKNRSVPVSESTKMQLEVYLERN